MEINEFERDPIKNRAQIEKHFNIRYSETINNIDFFIDGGEYVCFCPHTGIKINLIRYGRDMNEWTSRLKGNFYKDEFTKFINNFPDCPRIPK